MPSPLPATENNSFLLQQVFINPKPVSLGVQIEGVDITMNGNLNGLPLEPPNPSICVGNGFVMEATNDVCTPPSPTPPPLPRYRCVENLHIIVRPHEGDIAGSFLENYHQ